MDDGEQQLTRVGDERPAAVVDGAVDRVVAQLAELKRSSTLETTFAVGRIVIDGIYGGDLTAWRSRGQKDASFRKLAERDDLPMKATTIYQSVAVYELVQRLGLSSPKHLSTSHLRVALGLPEAQQRKLLSTADQEAWPVTRMEAAAREHRREGRGGGRPVVPVFLKALRVWTKATGADGLFEADLDAVEALKPEERSEAKQAVEAMQRQLAALARRLGGPGVADQPAPEEERPAERAKGGRRRRTPA